MRDLVHDGVAHDGSLPARRRGHPFDGSAENADAVRKIWLLRAALGEGHAFVQTEQGPAFRGSLRRRLVLYDDLQISHSLAELRWELVQRVAHEAREARTPQIGHGRTLPMGIP